MSKKSNVVLMSNSLLKISLVLVRIIKLIVLNVIHYFINWF